MHKEKLQTKQGGAVAAALTQVTVFFFATAFFMWSP
jgi:hypothetical protein